MKWKIGADGKIVVDSNGNPVYVNDRNEEISLELEKTLTTINNLFGEAKGHREAKDAALLKLKDFEGLDATEAKKAIETVKSFVGKTAVDAAALEKVRTDTAAETTRAVEAKYKPLREENDKLKSQFKTNTLNAFFGTSEFIKARGAVPAEMFQAYFGKHFDVTDDGKITAKGHDGNQILSKRNPGQHAEPNEALEILVDGYQHKNQILKGLGASGSGTPNGQGQQQQGGVKPKMTRVEFDAIQNGAEKAKVAGSHEIVDA